MNRAAIALILLILTFGYSGYSQTISTIAGHSCSSDSGDGGVPTAACLAIPAYLFVDNFNSVYFGTIFGFHVRKVVPGMLIISIAGTGVRGYSGDGGPATLAQLYNPQGVAVDSAGNIFISDADKNVVRKINVHTGIISNYAGTGSAGSSGDGGQATAAQLYAPNGMCFDKQWNLYVADYLNSKIRRITPAGIISTFAGTGVSGYNGDGGRADTSQIRLPHDVASDTAGNIYISDEGNYRIRKVNTSGIISTVAGNGSSASHGHSGDGGPATNATILTRGLCVDRIGNIYIGDSYNHAVRRVNTSGIIEKIAGTYETSGFSGDGGPASSALFYYPASVKTDTCDDLLVDDSNNYRIRKITFPHSTTSIPGLSISASTDTLCAGTPIALTLSSTGGGTYWSYQWFKNDTAISGATNVTYSYAPINGDSIKCKATTWNSCMNPSSSFSNTIHFTVIPISTALPSITIVPHPNDTVCLGDVIWFSSTLTGGVSSPSFQWKVNGVNVGTGADTFQYIPTNGDSVKCVVFTNVPCSLYPIVISNTVDIVVDTIVHPLLSISGPSSATIGSLVTVTGTVSGVGTGVAYHINWFNNGAYFTTTIVPSVNYTKTIAHDSITAVIVPEVICFDSAFSNFVVVTEKNAGINSLNKEPEFSFFPEPFEHFIVIQSKSTIESVEVFDLLGRLVQRISVNHLASYQLNMDEFNSGIYFLRLNGLSTFKITKL